MNILHENDFVDVIFARRAFPLIVLFYKKNGRSYMARWMAT